MIRTHRTEATRPPRVVRMLEKHLLTLQPDEAMSLLMMPSAPDVGFRWSGASEVTLEEHLS